MQHGHARWAVNDLEGGGVERDKVYPDAVCENNKFIIASSPGKIRTEHRQTCRACHFSAFNTSSDSPSPLTANKNFTACIHTGTQPLDHVVPVVQWRNCLCAPWPRLACFPPLFTNKSWKQRHQPWQQHWCKGSVVLDQNWFLLGGSNCVRRFEVWLKCFLKTVWMYCLHLNRGEI